MTKREIPILTVVSIALAVGMTWPLAGHLGSQIAGSSSNLADPMLEAWTVAWGGYALLHHPGGFFDANVFWPLHDSLAFSESLAGFAPAGMIGSSQHAAIIRYNLLFLFAYVLAFCGAYALARELGARKPGAFVAGAAFAYAPFRLAHQTHLHVLASGGIPLALALLLHGYRRARWPFIVAGWLVALWQISLGWNLGLPFVYLLGLLAVGCVIFSWRAGESLPPMQVIMATGGAGGITLLGTLLLALPYLHVLDRHPEARRTPDILFFFSPSVKSLAAAPKEDLLWGGVTASLRSLPGNEKSLFLGATVIMLALAGAVGGRYSKRTRLLLTIAALGLAVLSLGFGFHGGRASYRLLYDYAPGWQGLRTPGRLVTFTSLAIALLAASGTDRIVRGANRLRPRAPVAIAVVLIALVLLEGYGSIGGVQPPSPPTAFRSAPGPTILLPADSDLVNATAMFWSIGEFHPVANGWSGFHPRKYTDLIERIRAFPDVASVRALRAYGIRTVILDRQAAKSTEWAKVAGRPTVRLAIRRTNVPGYILYDLQRHQ